MQIVLFPLSGYKAQLPIARPCKWLQTDCFLAGLTVNSLLESTHGACMKQLQPRIFLLRAGIRSVAPYCLKLTLTFFKWIHSKIDAESPGSREHPISQKSLQPVAMLSNKGRVLVSERTASATVKEVRKGCLLLTPYLCGERRGVVALLWRINWGYLSKLT